MNREELLFKVKILSRSLEDQTFTQLVKKTLPSDLVEVLEELTLQENLALLMLLEPYTRAALFAHYPNERQDALLRKMHRTSVVQIFEQMPSDDRADLFNRLAHDDRQKLLPALAHVERDDILRMAAYPEGSVGSETTSDYVSVSEDMTVAQAIMHIRLTAPDKETIYVIYVLDSQSKLCGTVSLRDLVLADVQDYISLLMHPNPVFACASWPRQQATEMIRRYNLLALPVINSGEKMIGIVTVDDAMDIEKELDATQLARFGGTSMTGGEDLDVLTSPFTQMFKVRFFWLAILTIFGIMTSTFVAAQEELLSKAIVLAAFIAPIVDMGGNTGSQSATLVIRAMALGGVKLKWRDVGFIVSRELPVVLALGIIIAVLEAVLAYFSKGVGIDVLTVVGMSMLICTALGGVIGALLPFIARRIGTDPATLSSPLITSIMDLLGVLIYFGFAYAFLDHLLV